MRYTHIHIQVFYLKQIKASDPKEPRHESFELWEQSDFPRSLTGHEPTNDNLFAFCCQFLHTAVSYNCF